MIILVFQTLFFPPRFVYVSYSLSCDSSTLLHHSSLIPIESQDLEAEKELFNSKQNFLLSNAWSGRKNELAYFHDQIRKVESICLLILLNVGVNYIYGIQYFSL